MFQRLATSLRKSYMLHDRRSRWQRRAKIICLSETKRRELAAREITEICYDGQG